MLRADTIDLITETRSGHGVHEAVTETARTVFCTVQSVTRNEYYTGLNAGVTPEFVFRLALAEDYQTERLMNRITELANEHSAKEGERHEN